MARFSLEVIEHQGHRERTAIRADDYEDLAEKIAAKTGIALASDSDSDSGSASEDGTVLADGGEK